MPAARNSAFAASSFGPPPSPTRPPNLSLDDVPVRTTALPVFGTLQLHPQLEARDVREAFRRLAALFGSRVKTVPQDLLKKFQEKAQATGPY